MSLLSLRFLTRLYIGHRGIVKKRIAGGAPAIAPPTLLVGYAVSEEIIDEDDVPDDVWPYIEPAIAFYKSQK